MYRGLLRRIPTPQAQVQKQAQKQTQNENALTVSYEDICGAKTSIAIVPLSTPVGTNLSGKFTINVRNMAGS